MTSVREPLVGVGGPSEVTSPFRVKGVLYLGTLSYFENNVPGGAAGLLESIKEPALRAFLSQHFMASSWYEVMNVPALIEAEALRVGATVPVYLEGRTRWQAQKDTAGVYSFLLKMVPPSLAMDRLPRIMTQMFSFGRPDAKKVEKGHVVVEIGGIPAALAPWLETALAVYTRTVLAACGTTTQSVAVRPARVEPSQDGYPMCAVLAEAKWT